MTRYAVFVDVGYLAAAGQWAVTGQWRARSAYEMDGTGAVRIIKAEAARQMPGRELLRVYWYDAAAGRLPTEEHRLIASLDDVVVRLGNYNSRGVQKGVDSMIVLDMYDAALTGSVTDCVLLAGDGDLVDGVSRSQARGARVTVWSFATARSTTSPELRAAADRHRYLDHGLFAPVFGPADDTLANAGKIAGAIEANGRPAISTFPSGQQVISGAKEAGAAYARHVVSTVPYQRLAEIFDAAPFVPADIDSKLIHYTLHELGLDPTADVLPNEAVIAMREGFVAEAVAGTRQLVVGSNGHGTH